MRKSLFPAALLACPVAVYAAPPAAPSSAPSMAQVRAALAPNAQPAVTAPTKTDKLLGQSATGVVASYTPEQIVSAGGSPTASMAGMVSGGADNAGNVAALNNLLGKAYSGYSVRFTADPSKSTTVYYFSQPLGLYRSGTVTCDGTGFSGQAGVALVFAAGIDGVVAYSPNTSNNNGPGSGTLENCEIISLGQGSGNQTQGSGTITGAAMGGIAGVTSPLPQAGDGLIVWQNYYGSTIARPISVPTGTSVGSVSGTTITLGNGAVFDGDSSTAGNGRAGFYRLPAAMADLCNTTAGSPSVTCTSGTTTFMPGDMIWSSAFPFWTRVGVVSGTAGSQTFTAAERFFNGSINATATTTGAPIWRIPAGYRRLTGTQTRNVFIVNWPTGMDMPCNTAQSTNCTGSKDYNDVYQGNWIGKSVAGNNTGASNDYGSVFATSYLHDIIEGGSIGSAYFGTNSNSGESTSLQPVVGNCVNQAQTLFSGSYIGSPGASWTYCVTGGGANSGAVFYQPQAGFPNDTVITQHGTVQSTVSAQVQQSTKKAAITSGTYDSSTGNVVVNLASAIPLTVGDTVVLSDLTGTGNVRFNLGGNRVTQAGSTTTVLNLKIAAGLPNLAITAGAVSTATSNGCTGTNLNNYPWVILRKCGDGGSGFGWVWQTYQGNALEWLTSADGTATFRITQPGYLYYGGDGKPYFNTPRGLILGEASYQRLLLTSPTIPTTTWNKAGDYYLNTNTVAGGSPGWAYTAAGWLPAAPIARDVNGLGWNLPIVVSTGTKPTLSGTCAAGNQVGGASVGSFTTTSGCSLNQTIKLTFAVAAPSGWRCTAVDETSVTAALQSADDANSCTLNMPMTSAGDKIVFEAKAF